MGGRGSGEEVLSGDEGEGGGDEEKEWEVRKWGLVGECGCEWGI